MQLWDKCFSYFLSSQHDLRDIKSAWDNAVNRHKVEVMPVKQVIQYQNITTHMMCSDAIWRSFSSTWRRTYDIRLATIGIRSCATVGTATVGCSISRRRPAAARCMHRRRVETGTRRRERAVGDVGSVSAHAQIGRWDDCFRRRGSARLVVWTGWSCVVRVGSIRHWLGHCQSVELGVTDQLVEIYLNVYNATHVPQAAEYCMHLKTIILTNLYSWKSGKNE